MVYISLKKVLFTNAFPYLQCLLENFAIFLNSKIYFLVGNLYTINLYILIQKFLFLCYKI